MKDSIKSTDHISRILNENLPALQSRFPVARVGIFGSRTRNEYTSDSDVDILVELDGPIGLEIVDLRDEFELLLGLSVDLVTLGAVQQNPLLWQSIQEDVLYV